MDQLNPVQASGAWVGSVLATFEETWRPEALSTNSAKAVEMVPSTTKEKFAAYEFIKLALRYAGIPPEEVSSSAKVVGKAELSLW